ncbi:hypothetical protein [Rhizobacter sp. Root1221]|uniref:hypothetical protein n=1 Tax=Rhizobacter sp. Root1221 TaxID=1736433 RepID=UPI0006F76A44|nr:hypothetical protein [Rhizobacter sp. Root1221]KQV85437.1 hypothetical protein ASC87_07025 [Rhizobacter sp. Root1221]
MAILFVQKNSTPWRTLNSTGAQAVNALPSAVTAGNCLTLQVGNYPAGIDTITDSQGNTWLQGRVNGDGDNNFIEIWYALNVAAGTTTVTVDALPGGDNDYFSGVLQEFSGVVLTSALRDSGASSISSVSSDGTSTQVGDLVLVGMVADAGANPLNFANPTGFTLDDVEQDSTTTTGYLASHMVATAAGSQATSSMNPSGYDVEAVMVVLAAAGSDGSFIAAQTDAGAATEAQGGAAALEQAVAEAGAADTAQASSAAGAAALIEATGSSESQAFTLGLLAGVSEAGVAGDTQSIALVASVAMAESTAASESAAATGDYVASLVDAASGSDAGSAGLSASGERSEPAAASEVSNGLAAGAFEVATTEVAAPVESVAGAGSAVPFIAEAVAANDSQAHTLAAGAGVTEAAAAVETAGAVVAAPGQFAGSIIEESNGTDASTATGQTAAAVIEVSASTSQSGAALGVFASLITAAQAADLAVGHFSETGPGESEAWRFVVPGQGMRFVVGAEGMRFVVAASGGTYVVLPG